MASRPCLLYGIRTSQQLPSAQPFSGTYSDQGQDHVCRDGCQTGDLIGILPSVRLHLLFFFLQITCVFGLKYTYQALCFISTATCLAHENGPWSPNLFILGEGTLTSTIRPLRRSEKHPYPIALDILQFLLLQHNTSCYCSHQDRRCASLNSALVRVSTPERLQKPQSCRGYRKTIQPSHV